MIAGWNSIPSECVSLATDVVIVMSPPPSLSHVSQYRLWTGPSAVLDDPGAVCALGVEAVVCVAPEPLPQRWPRELIYLRIPLNDGENAPVALRRVVDIVQGLIRDAVPTLVVCSMGHSRSIAVAAAAIAACESADADEVLQRITAGRPADVSPLLWDAFKRIL